MGAMGNMHDAFLFLSPTKGTVGVRSWVLIGEVRGSTPTSSLYILACVYVGFFPTSVGFLPGAGLSSHFGGLSYQVYRALYNYKKKKKVPIIRS